MMSTHCNTPQHAYCNTHTTTPHCNTWHNTVSLLSINTLWIEKVLFNSKHCNTHTATRAYYYTTLQHMTPNCVSFADQHTLNGEGPFRFKTLQHTHCNTHITTPQCNTRQNTATPLSINTLWLEKVLCNWTFQFKMESAPNSCTTRITTHTWLHPTATHDNTLCLFCRWKNYNLNCQGPSRLKIE